VSPRNQTPAATVAAEPAIAGSLLDSVQEIAPSPVNYQRIEKLRNYRGLPRTEVDAFGWNALRYAAKVLASRIDPLDQYSDLPELVGEGLFSLQHSRPAKQLFMDILLAAGIDDAYTSWSEWWDERASRKPADDFHSLFILSECYSWPAMQNRPPAQPVPTSRFTPRIPELNSPKTRWIVKGVIPERSLTVIYGRWGSGKSTVAIEVCADIALGTPWHGHKAKQGVVVYVASENAHGVRARLDALLRERGITLDAFEGRFLEITGRPHLLKPDEVQELIKELKPFGPSLIVIDTLARAVAGSDENAAQETGILVENCQTLINATGATVCLVHHTGKDGSKGMRGSSALPAAADAEIIIERPDDAGNFRTVKLGKARDAQDYYDLFKCELKLVELGIDEDGEKITSTVVHEIAGAPEGRLTIPELPNSPIRRAIRDVLGAAQRAIPFEELIDLVKGQLAPPDPGTKDRRRGRIRQAVERMIGDRELHVDPNGMASQLDPAMPFTPVVDASAADPNSDLTDERGAV
jgi:hypothetical protein